MVMSDCLNPFTPLPSLAVEADWKRKEGLAISIRSKYGSPRIGHELLNRLQPFYPLTGKSNLPLNG